MVSHTQLVHRILSMALAIGPTIAIAIAILNAALLLHRARTVLANHLHLVCGHHLAHLTHLAHLAHLTHLRHLSHLSHLAHLTGGIRIHATVDNGFHVFGRRWCSLRNIGEFGRRHLMV